MADKTKTIKYATDKELDELLIRLRKEQELQYLIGGLKRASSPQEIPYDQPNVSTEEPIESLYHYGRLGMKWGRRKSRSGGGRSLITIRRVVVKKPKEDHEDDINERDSLKKKSVNQLSTADLKKLNNRLQMEKQYKDLTKKELSPGRKFVTDVVGSAAKQTATSYTAKFMTDMIESAIKK